MYRLYQDFYHNCFFHLSSILPLSDKQHRKGKWTFGKCKINTKVFFIKSCFADNHF